MKERCQRFVHIFAFGLFEEIEGMFKTKHKTIFSPSQRIALGLLDCGRGLGKGLRKLIFRRC